MDVLQRVGDREPRLRSQVDRGVAVCQVQVHQQHRARVQQGQVGGDVDGGRRRPDASLGSEEGEHVAAGLGFPGRCEAREGRIELFGRERELQAFLDAGAHGLQHQRGIERGD